MGGDAAQVMVGRDRELARVTGLLDDALAGRGRLVLCTGEAGIGKIRLAEELAATASARGVPVAWSRAADRGSGAWVETVNPATWSEELLVTLHREVLLLPGTKGMSDVASGLTDALIIAGMPMGYEDIAPIPLIITEAGGRVSDLDGNDVLTGNGTVLASNGHIHDALLNLVRDLPAGRDYQSLIQARQ